MAIQVTCPGCHTRFSVAEQHAGKQGPCPKCKKTIRIPKLEEQVVIHAPVEGPVDAQGRPVLKTERRRDTQFQPIVATAVAGAVLVTLLIAILMRGQITAENGAVILGAGAVLLGPLLSWAGYSFLRDSELEPYRGGELWVRATVCGLVYALLWFVYVFVASRIGGPDWAVKGLETWQMLVPSVLVLGAGTLAGYAALDLEPLNAFFHCAMYFAVTILLRITLALPAIPGLGSTG